MRTKKFNVSLAPFNNVKVFEAENGTILRTIKVEGTIIGTPSVSGNNMTVKVKKGEEIHENLYILPLGLLKESNIVA